MKDLHPNLRAALLWLLNQDSNGDSIPNGPSLWHEVNSRYTSLFTSDLWLTALRVGEELLGELEMQSQARAMRIESANNLNSQLWNGRYYNIYFDPSNPLSSLDQPYLLGNLPGERFTFSIGLNSFLDVHRLNRNFHSLASSFDTIHESSLIIPSPSATAQLFAQAFDAAALIRFGYVNETLSYLQKTPVEYQISRISASGQYWKRTRHLDRPDPPHVNYRTNSPANQYSTAALQYRQSAGVCTVSALRAGGGGAV